MARRRLIAGNWKMNGTLRETETLLGGILDGVGQIAPEVDLLVIPPYTALQTARCVLEGSDGRIALGAQNMHPEARGAFTGEVSAAMLVDIGATHVLVGHSERRVHFHESDEFLRRKVATALGAGLIPILCIGELLKQREAGATEQVLDGQLAGALTGIDADGLARLVLAYEPVWAIGTGKVATPEQAEDAHRHIRGWLASTYGDLPAAAARVLYGGSVTAANAAGLLARPGVDGALVGGASLKADEFLGIARAA